MTREEARQRVEAGIAFLDSKRIPFRRKLRDAIKNDEFRMISGCDCVIGHLYPDDGFWRGSEILFVTSSDSEIIKRAKPLGFWSHDFDYDMLQEAWEEALTGQVSQ